jgi:hypothetical protein
MKFGGPEGFKQKTPESGDEKAFNDLAKVAEILTERSSKLPQALEAVNDNDIAANDNGVEDDGSKFGSEDLGDTVREVMNRG